MRKGSDLGTPEKLQRGKGRARSIWRTGACCIRDSHPLSPFFILFYFCFILLILHLFYTDFSIMSQQTFCLKILKTCILTVLLHRVIQTNCLIKLRLLYSLKDLVKHKNVNPAELYFTHGLNTIETH